MALENGRANERRIAARGKMRRPELREERRVDMPIERLRRRCDRTSNCPGAGFKAATHRALAFRATRVL